MRSGRPIDADASQTRRHYRLGVSSLHPVSRTMRGEGPAKRKRPQPGGELRRRGAHIMRVPVGRDRHVKIRGLLQFLEIMSALQIKLGPKPTGNEMNDVKKIVVLRPAAHNNHPPCAGIRLNRNQGAIGHRAESPHLHSDHGFKLCRSFRRLIHIAPSRNQRLIGRARNFSCSFGPLVAIWHLALCRFFTVPGASLPRK
jgi:hypothetical protein